jgi:hypothetical protein
MKEGFGNGEFLSMELYVGKLEGGSFTGDTGGYVKEGSGEGQLSPYEPVANLAGGLLY